MSILPRRVEFHEEGPREGFQMEQATYPLDDRLTLIDALAASGLKQVQCASFVSPRAVPQMADSPELFARLRKRVGTRYRALWLNENGFDRARACDNVDIDGKVVFYVTEPFSQRNNNCSVAENRERQLAWIDRYIVLGIPVEQAYVVTAFGSVESAIAAIRAGAEDFLPKPFELEQLQFSMERALRNRELKREVRRLRDLVHTSPEASLLLGESPAMRFVTDLVHRIADVDTTVLITGESGTGP